MKSDQEFLAQLRAYLCVTPAVPIFRRADGSIDREKTLALPCYSDFKPQP